MLAHLSILLNLITGMLGPIAALGIYLLYKDRSQVVAYHAMQALLFQLIAWLGGGALAAAAFALSGILSAILIGLLCLPFAFLTLLIPLGALVYGVVAAIQVGQGNEFDYLLVADMARSIISV